MAISEAAPDVFICENAKEENKQKKRRIRRNFITII